MALSRGLLKVHPSHMQALQSTCSSALKGAFVKYPGRQLHHIYFRSHTRMAGLIRVDTIESRKHSPWSGGSHGLFERMISRSLSREMSWTSEDISADVGILVEGLQGVDDLVDCLYGDAVTVVKHAVYHACKARMEDGEDVSFPRPVELSLVLCDDDHIRGLNKEWRRVDKPTDVLAFEMNVDDEEDYSFEQFYDEDATEAKGDIEEDIEEDIDEDIEELQKVFEGDGPVVMLGDVVISIDTAKRQANERGHSLRDECRILLIHGVLHLLGYDHEYSEEDAEEMHAAEVSILRQAGFQGDSGLIGFGAEHEPNIQTRSKISSDIKLLCLDMDGTLLDSKSEVLPSSVEALRIAIDRGVQVILATGKARPAAMKALDNIDLKKGMIVGIDTPGIFLQGLQVYGRNGCVLGGGSLDMSIVQKVLSYAVKNDVSVTCFLGDDCVSPKITRELEELHYRYYEPYPKVMSPKDIVEGPSVRKMLLMQDPDSIRLLRQIMDQDLAHTNAGTMQAVDTMLEIVPQGFNKWTALQLLLSHLDGVNAHNVMAIGDGENDLQMIQGAGIGVAMGNAVAVVKDSADVIVSSNDDDGIYEAVERFILHS